MTSLTDDLAAFFPDHGDDPPPPRKGTKKQRAWWAQMKARAPGWQAESAKRGRDAQKARRDGERHAD